MNFLYFVMELTHDDGKAYLKTCARNADIAKQNTMNIENCPMSAIRIMEIPEGLFSMNAENLFKNFEKAHFGN